MRGGLRSFAWKVLPEVMAERDRRRQVGLRCRLGIHQRARQHVATYGDAVRDGPFTGLRFPVDLLGEANAPVAKLTGLYECELLPHLEEMIGRLEDAPGSTFVDLGSADGFYAAGFAYRAPRSRVVAFDLARSARSATERLAHANRLAVEIRGRATPREIQSLAGTTVALLCDIEGAEVDVLSQRVARSLSSAMVVVELHDRLRPGCTAAMTERFAPSHEARIVTQGSPASAPGVDEMRAGPGRWAVFRPR